MAEQFLAYLGETPAAVPAVVSVSVGVVVLVSTLVALERQRRVVARLEERLTHLHAGLSLLTNTTEDGLRGVALEVARLAGVAETKPREVTNTRQRITAAAGHGRSVQDIAATEQVSEGEVLLHLLLDKIKPEAASAEMC